MKTLVAVALLLIPSAVLAEGPVQSGARRAAGQLDPNQMICRRYRESGTRIAIRRECMTRAQWDAHFQTTRQNVDRAQLTRVIGGK